MLSQEKDIGTIKKIFSGFGAKKEPSALKTVFPLDTETIKSRRREMTPVNQEDPGVQYLNSRAPEGYMVDMPKAEKLIAFTQEQHPELEGEDLIKKAADYMPQLKAYEEKKNPPKKDNIQGSRYGAIQDDKNIFGLPKIPRFNDMADTSVEEGATRGQVLGDFAKNTVKSGLNLASDVTNFVLDPIDSAKGLVNIAGGAAVRGYEMATGKEADGRAGEMADVAEMAGNYFKERYGSAEGFSKASYQDPVGVFSDIVSLIGGGAGIASKISKASGFTNTANKLSNLSKIGAYDPANMVLDAEANAVKNVTNEVVKPVVKKGAEFVKGQVDNTLEWIHTQKVGLTPEEVQGITSNPYQADYWNQTKQIIEEQGVPQDIKSLTLPLNEELARKLEGAIASYEKVHSDSGPLYNDIRKGNTPVKLTSATRPINNKLFSDYKIKVKPDGTLDFSQSKFQGVPSLQNQIQNAYDVARADKVVTPDGFLNKRQSLDLQSKWEGKPTAATPVVKMIRSQIDTVGKKGIPGLEEVDNLWSNQLKELEEMKSKLVYEAGPKKGQFRDNIVQIVKTLGKENRNPMLQRLLKIMPDLKDRVDAIQNIPKLAKAYTNIGKLSKNAQYVGGIAGTVVGSQVGGVLGGIIGGVVGTGITRYLEQFLGTIRKEALDNVISQQSPQALEKLKVIEQKLSGLKKLTADEQRLINQIKNKIGQEMEQFADTDTKKYKVDPGFARQTKGKGVTSTTNNPMEVRGLPAKSGLDDLATEAKKYKSADEFVSSQEGTYKMSHTAPTRSDGYAKSIDDLTDIYPDDLYSSEGARYYGDGSPYDAESVSILNSVKGKPNKEVTIYRAVPDDITNADKIRKYEAHKAYIQKNGKLPPEVTNWGDRSEYYNYISDEIDKLLKMPDVEGEKVVIRPGDWVSINRKYAVDHGKSNLDGGYKILSKKVKAKEIFSDGNSIHEQGYDPIQGGTKSREELRKIREEANGEGKTLYHGTNTKFDKFEDAKMGVGKLGKGVYLTDDVAVAKKFNDKTKVIKNKVGDKWVSERRKGDDSLILEVSIPKSIKVKEYKHLGEYYNDSHKYNTIEEFEKALRKEYDAVHLADEKEYVIFNAKDAKIIKEANK